MCRAWGPLADGVVPALEGGQRRAAHDGDLVAWEAAQRRAQSAAASPVHGPPKSLLRLLLLQHRVGAPSWCASRLQHLLQQQDRQ